MKIRKTVGLITLLSTVLTSATPATLILTGVLHTLADGSPSDESIRAVEFYTPNGEANLASYALRVYEDQSATPTHSASLPGVALSPGHFFYLIGTGDTTDFEAVFGTAGDFSNKAEHTAVTGNGNDVYELLRAGTEKDIYGGIGFAATAWNYTDSFAYRQDDTGPTSTWDGDGDETFDSAGANALLGLTASQIAATVPFGTYTSQDSIPEPSTLFFLGLGLLGYLRKRQRK